MLCMYMPCVRSQVSKVFFITYIKNCDPLVFGPLLAMDNSIGLSCFSWKPSSVKVNIFQKNSAIYHSFIQVSAMNKWNIFSKWEKKVQISKWPCNCLFIKSCKMSEYNVHNNVFWQFSENFQPLSKNFSKLSKICLKTRQMFPNIFQRFSNIS